MISKVCEIKGVTIYQDEYMEEKTIIRGRTQGSDSEFIIMQPIVANMLLIKSRKEKLKIINNISTEIKF